MVCIGKTKLEMERLVNPSNTNVINILHGGIMTEWLVEISMATASRHSNGRVLLAHVYDINFSKKVFVGNVVRFISYICNVGNTSMDVLTQAFVNDEKVVDSLFTYVAVDSSNRPRIVREKVEPCNEVEEALYNNVKKIRGNWIIGISKVKAEKFNIVDENEGLTNKSKDIFWVSPSQSVDGMIMSASRLLKQMDDLGAIVAGKYAEGTVVTVHIDESSFHGPVKVGSMLQLSAAITYVGNTSLEVRINVFCNDLEGNFFRVTSSYFTYVRIDKDGNPSRVRQYNPLNDYERKMFEEGVRRKEERLKKKLLLI
jgi:acyl-CoA hydrolase